MQQTNNIQPTPSHPLAHSSWPFRHFSVSIATHHTHIYNTLYNLASHQKHLVSHTPSPLSEGEGLGVRSLPYISNNYVFLKHCNIDVKHCNIDIKHCNIDIKHCNIDVKHCNIDVKHCNIDIKHCNIDIKHCNIDIKHCNIDVKHCNIDVKHCTFAAAIAFLEHHFHIIQTSNINNQSIVTN